MITVAGTEKKLSEMTDGELTVIIANCDHALRRGRCSNQAHRNYLYARAESCRQEMAGRR